MQSDNQTPRLIRLPEVIRLVGLSRSRILQLEASGQFPRRRKIGLRAVAWINTEVSAWIAARPVADQAQEAAQQ